MIIMNVPAFTAAESGEDFDESSEIAVAEKKPDVKEPLKYAVILHNDDYTTMEFVIEVLRKFFSKKIEEATQVMLQIHQKGSGVAGIYSLDIAETKVSQVTQYAQSSGFPLKCTIDKA